MAVADGSSQYADSKADVPQSSSVCGAMCNPLQTCPAFAGEFKSHPDRLSLWGVSKENQLWPHVYGTSPWFPETSPALMIVRTVLAIIFVVHLIWSVESYDLGRFWLMYLTHWSLVLETLYFILAAYAAWKGRRLLMSQADTQKLADTAIPLPWFVKVTWILFHVVMPVSMLVTCLYWTLLTPEKPTYLGCFVHGLNFVLCWTDLFLGRSLYYVKHSVWFLAYVVLYLVWSLVHYAARVGTKVACDDPNNPDDGNVPQNECAIYAVLNWRKAGSAAILSVIIVCCVAPLCQLPLWYCVRARNISDKYKNPRGQPEISQPAEISVPADSHVIQKVFEENP
ncbi:unnamed protein product [Polarella glacialis]|uniref:Uncharacterized protein n=2 Tax=Polarella glacialis TaxID=89957 RepID=A0A813EPX2_POLGL|nr:unnamed protein product [Polarella glacialis]